MLGDKGNSVGSAGASNYSGDGAGGQVNMDSVGGSTGNVLRNINGKWTVVSKETGAALGGQTGQTYITPASYPPTAPTVPTPTALTAPPVTEVAPAAIAPNVPMDPSIAGRLEAMNATAVAPAPAPASNAFRAPVANFATPATAKAATAPKVSTAPSVDTGLAGALKAGAGGTLAAPPRDDRMPSVPAPAPSVDNSARLAAITRGPGTSSPYQTNIAAVSTFPETPAGALDPAFNKAINTAALNKQSLFNLPNATPEQEALIDQVSPHAVMAAGAVGLHPMALMGQLITESTGANKTKLSGLATKYNNLFGIQTGKLAPNNWDGTKVSLKTKEMQKNGLLGPEMKDFRTYSSPEQSVYNYAELMGTPKYATKLAGKTTIADQLAAIRSGGYATHAAQAYVDMATKNASKFEIGGVPQPETQVASVQPKYNVAGVSMAPPAPKSPSVTETAKTEAAKLAEAITKVKQETAIAAGTLSSSYDVVEPTRVAAGTLTAPYEEKPQLLDDLRAKSQTAFDKWKAERAAKANTAKAAGTLTAPYDVAEDLTKAAYDKAQIGVEDLRGITSTVAGRPDVPVGSFPAAKPKLGTTVAGRPDVPVGSLPAAKFNTTVAGRPDVPVGSLPAASIQQPVSGPKTRTPVTTQPSGVVKAVENVDTPAYDPATGYGAPAPDLKPYTQTPEDLARQATQVAQFKASIKNGVNPALASTLSPITDAMKYYEDNKWSIGVANKMGLLEKPVKKVAGAAITQMQNYVKGLMAPVPKDVSPAKPGNLITTAPAATPKYAEYAKPPTKVAQTIVDHPVEAIEASPELQKLAVSSPTFLQRVFGDAAKGGKNSIFERYVATLAAPVTTPTTTSLSQNDALTELFAELSRTGTAPRV